jgi:hypothetical protein
VTCWLVTSRQLFRYWYRNDVLKNEDRGKKYPMSRGEVATIAMLASVAFPLVWAAILVLWRHPVSRRELGEKIAALEAENRKLRAADMGREADSRAGTRKAGRGERDSAGLPRLFRGKERVTSEMAMVADTLPSRRRVAVLAFRLSPGILRRKAPEEDTWDATGRR